MHSLSIAIPGDRIREFCLRDRIRKLSRFGSVLTNRFGPESGVDVLVEFEAGSHPTLLSLARMEIKLSAILGRKVDLRMPGDLSRLFRDEVLATVIPQYERV
jgi:hypothetical protein